VTSERELRAIAEQAGRKGAEDLLRLMGLDVDEPAEQMRDSVFVRKMRKASERSFIVAVTITVSSIVAGVLSLVWERITGGH